MENVFKEKYICSLCVWKQKNEVLIKTLEEYHQSLKEDFDWLKRFDKTGDVFSSSFIDEGEVAFVKMLKRLNEIIEILLSNNDKVIKYEILQKICASYSCIDGIQTLRLDRIFDKGIAEKRYERTYNMIQQYIRMIENLLDKFNAELIQIKESINSDY